MERTRARGRSSSIIHLVMKLMIENRKAFHHLLAANATMTNLSDRLPSETSEPQPYRDLGENRENCIKLACCCLAASSAISTSLYPFFSGRLTRLTSSAV